MANKERVEVYAAEIGDVNTTQEVKAVTTGATVNVTAFTARKNGREDFVQVAVHADKGCEISAHRVADFIVAQVGEVKVFLTPDQAAALCKALWTAGKAE